MAGRSVFAATVAVPPTSWPSLLPPAPPSCRLAMAQHLLGQRFEILCAVSARVVGEDRLAADLGLVDRLRLADDRLQQQLLHVLQLAVDVVVGLAIPAVEGVAQDEAPALAVAAQHFDRGEEIGNAVEGILAVGGG